MLIEAAQRLRAMSITQGDNYSRGPEDAKRFLTKTDPSDFTILYRSEDTVLLKCTPYVHDTHYILAELSKDVATLRSNLKDENSESLKGCGVKRIFGLLKTYQDTFGSQVGGVWVDRSMRGHGYGKGLYIAARHYGKKTLSSSYDLGTMSLATWLSLYKSNPSIYIEVSNNIRTRRDEIKIEGLNLTYLHPQGPISLTTSSKPDFRFVWPK